MNAERLVAMANQIGAFFESEPDRKTALDGVAQHLKKFWDPRMRRELLAWVDQHAGEGLKPLVQAAIAANRASLQPRDGLK